MPFKIKVVPTDVRNEFDVQVADHTVSKVISKRPLSELEADYQLPSVWLRYMNIDSIGHPDLHIRDTDIEIVARIQFLTAGLSL